MAATCAMRCVRLVVRRMALRKGVILTAAGLIIVGALCLYFLLPKKEGEAKIRTVHAVSKVYLVF